MRHTRLLFGGLLLLWSATSCTSVKRFKSAEYKGADHSLVDVELHSTRLDAPETPPQDMHLWNLSANAQTRLIQILDERYPDNAQFMDVLSRNYQPGGDISLMDYTRKDLWMVFSITREHDYPAIHDPAGRYSPADRIEYLRLTLEIPEQHHLKFTRWNRYATEYGEMEIADVSFSRSLELDASGEPGGLEVGGRASLSRNERQVIESRYLKLNGRLSPTQVVLEEEGARSLDLTGNISASVSLEFEGFPERLAVPLLSDSGILVTGFRDVLVPAMEEAPDTLYALLTLDYIYRHVAAGWLTFAEWDDRVEYYEGRVQKKVPLFTRQDYLPGFYCIGNDREERNTVKVSQQNGKEYLLQFVDYPTASLFLDWLANPDRDPSNPVKLDSGQLLYKGRPLTPAGISEDGLKVMPVY